MGKNIEMEFENENGTANTWWAGMVTQYNPTNDQYAAFFPSDHTSRQMIKTIALFPRTLTYALYNSSNSTQWWVPTHWYTSHLSFFSWKLILSVQGRLSLHFTSYVMWYAMATFINLTFITHFCDGTRNISYAGVHHEIHMYKVVIGLAGSRAIRLGKGQGQCWMHMHAHYVYSM